MVTLASTSHWSQSSTVEEVEDNNGHLHHNIPLKKNPIIIMNCLRTRTTFLVYLTLKIASLIIRLSWLPRNPQLPRLTIVHHRSKMLKKTLAISLSPPTWMTTLHWLKKKSNHCSKKSTKGCKTSNESDVEIIEKPEDPEEELSALVKELWKFDRDLT